MIVFSANEAPPLQSLMYTSLCAASSASTAKFHCASAIPHASCGTMRGSYLHDSMVTMTGVVSCTPRPTSTCKACLSRDALDVQNPSASIFLGSEVRGWTLVTLTQQGACRCADRHQ